MANGLHRCALTETLHYFYAHRGAEEGVLVASLCLTLAVVGWAGVRGFGFGRRRRGLVIVANRPL